MELVVEQHYFMIYRQNWEKKKKDAHSSLVIADKRQQMSVAKVVKKRRLASH